MLFTFQTEKVAVLLRHALEAMEHSPTFGQLYDADCRKDGRKFEGSGHPTGEDVDYAKVPAALHLVHDSGVYLMSNGRPGLMKPGQPAGSTRHEVVYADGYGEDVYVPGDDYCDVIPVAWIESAIASGAATFSINVSESQMELVLGRTKRK